MQYEPLIRPLPPEPNWRPKRTSVGARRPMRRSRPSNRHAAPTRYRVALRGAHESREDRLRSVERPVRPRGRRGRPGQAPRTNTFAIRAARSRSTEITTAARSARSSTSPETGAGACSLSVRSTTRSARASTSGSAVARSRCRRLSSGRHRTGGGDDGLAIDSVALTASPARVYPRPVTFLEGRLDHRQAANRWRSRLDRVEFALLERAAIARADRRRGDPIVIDELVDPRARGSPAPSSGSTRTASRSAPPRCGRPRRPSTARKASGGCGPARSSA